MTNIAWKNLVHERTRFAISVMGVAFSVVFIVTLRSLYWGVIDEATRYVRSSGADLWVAQEGTPGDFLQSRSILTLAAQPQIAQVRGVSPVAPLLSRPVGLRLKNRDADLFLLGIPPGGQVGWPAAVRNGNTVLGPGEMAVDRVFAKNFGVKAGDMLAIGPTCLRVGAVVSGGNAFAYQFVWATWPTSPPSPAPRASPAPTWSTRPAARTPTPWGAASSSRCRAPRSAPVPNWRTATPTTCGRGSCPSSGCWSSWPWWWERPSSA
ncbi:MAG: ABC transporter permease [Acidimicrobiales bacterium]